MTTKDLPLWCAIVYDMQYIGLVSVLFLIIALVSLEAVWGPAYTKTFSRLVARRRSSVIYYFVVFCIFLTGLSLFVIESLIPRLGLPAIFTWIFFLGVAAQIVCITVPETKGLKAKVHLTAAAVMSVSCLLQVLMIVFLAQLSTISLAVSVVSAMVMLFVWSVVIGKFKVARYELALQSVYFASYLTVIMTVGYLG